MALMKRKRVLSTTLVVGAFVLYCFCVFQKGVDFHVAIGRFMGDMLSAEAEVSPVRQAFEENQSPTDMTARKVKRNFDYVREPFEIRYRGRNIMFVFSGRRSNQETQMLYLERLISDGEIDFVHYYHCAPAPADSAWLKSLPRKYPAWFELRPCTGDKDFGRIFQDYERQEYQNSTFVKIDDDIVYLPTGGAITRALEYTRAHPEVSWVSGMVVNNKLIDYQLRLDGIIQETPDLQLPLPVESYGGKDVIGLPSVKEFEKHPKSWQALHDLFLTKGETLRSLEGIRTFPPGYRVCLNAMFFTPEQLKRWEMKPKSFDEIQIKVMNWMKNLTVDVYLGAPFVHLGYGRQRQAQVTKKGYSEKYARLACEVLNVTSNALC